MWWPSSSLRALRVNRLRLRLASIHKRHIWVVRRRGCDELYKPVAVKVLQFSLDAQHAFSKSVVVYNKLRETEIRKHPHLITKHPHHQLPHIPHIWAPSNIQLRQELNHHPSSTSTKLPWIESSQSSQLQSERSFCFENFEDLLIRRFVSRWYHSKESQTTGLGNLVLVAYMHLYIRTSQFRSVSYAIGTSKGTYLFSLMFLSFFTLYSS